MVRLLTADLKIMFRDKLSIFWALIFPLIFISVFALFNLDEPPEVNLAIVNQDSGSFSQRLIEDLGTVEVFEVAQVREEERAMGDLADGEFDMVLLLPAGIGREPQTRATVIYGSSNPQLVQLALNSLRRFFGDFNLEVSGLAPIVALNEEPISTRDVGYMDFLVPGILGMGLMTYAVIGIATLLVTYHEKRILRRIQMTPLPIAAFVIAQVAAFLVLSVLQTGVILAAGTVAGADLSDTFFWAFPIALLGNVVFLNLGIMVAAGSRTVNAASGLGNVITLPMMFLSGVFFPTEQLPAALERIVSYLPLTPLLAALRAVLLDNESIVEATNDLTLLAGWAIATSVLAARVFKME
jgi:ABC-2 type transport system permease protein